MKTVLTLKAGSFFFLEGVHLIRDVPQEVDLSVLKVEDRKAVRLYLASGHLESSEEIPEDALKIEDVGTEGFEVAVKEEQIEDGREGHSNVLESRSAVSTPEETDETRAVSEGKYNGMVKRELLALIKERGIETDATTNADLIKELEKWDASQEGSDTL